MSKERPVSLVKDFGMRDRVKLASGKAAVSLLVFAVTLTCCLQPIFYVVNAPLRRTEACLLGSASVI